MHLTTAIRLVVADIRAEAPELSWTIAEAVAAVRADLLDDELVLLAHLVDADTRAAYAVVLAAGDDEIVRALAELRSQ